MLKSHHSAILSMKIHPKQMFYNIPTHKIIKMSGINEMQHKERRLLFKIQLNHVL